MVKISPAGMGSVKFLILFEEGELYGSKKVCPFAFDLNGVEYRSGDLESFSARGELSTRSVAHSRNIQVDPFWPKSLPGDWITGNIGGTCVDSNDHVLLARVTGPVV